MRTRDENDENTTTTTSRLLPHRADAARRRPPSDAAAAADAPRVGVDFHTVHSRPGGTCLHPLPARAGLQAAAKFRTCVHKCPYIVCARGPRARRAAKAPHIGSEGRGAPGGDEAHGMCPRFHLGGAWSAPNPSTHTCTAGCTVVPNTNYLMKLLISTHVIADGANICSSTR